MDDEVSKGLKYYNSVFCNSKLRRRSRHFLTTFSYDVKAKEMYSVQVPTYTTLTETVKTLPILERHLYKLINYLVGNSEVILKARLNLSKLNH